jgi:outer membrane protein assembly factor BamD (BamD/ComL family)
MRSLPIALALVAALAVSGFAQTAVELKKELLPKIKKAQAEGKSLGEAEQFYKQGDEALKNGLQDEAVDAFKKAKEAMPAD